MSHCPFPHHKLRQDLPPLTPRIAALPVDERGYPVPFFVQWLDENNQPTPAGTGRPEFRMMDGSKFVRCVTEKLCWVCGERLGVHLAFVLGPMCTVSRTISEPPSHLECAHWSVKGCPFLSRPNMVRREDEFTEANKDNVAGIGIRRNPGAMAIWVTKSYRLFRTPQEGQSNQGILITVGDPEAIEWWSQGRIATRDEVMQAIDSGLPFLHELCDSPEAFADLDKRVQYVRDHYLPKE